jgi:Arc/MetJ-type ribon-helix-helix transcriptional regulator
MKTSVQARLDPESSEALETLTRRLGMSQSEVVRASLRLMVKEHAAPKRKKFIGLGQFDSGIGDLATNKKHMEGFGLSREDRLKRERSKPASSRESR